MRHAVIGSGCNVCDHAYVDDDVRVGDRVTIKSGSCVCDGVTLGDDVFIGPWVTFTNDPFPRSRQPFQCRRTVVEDGASVGAGAVVLPGIRIGARAMVGAGAVVTRDVPEATVVVGNPAQVVRCVDGELSGVREPVVV
ncbi:MAG: acyltransferase [Trebonia sp.]